MKKLLFILFLLPIISKAEIIHGTVSGSNYSYNVEVYIPDNTTGRLKTMFFFPGNGEVGTDRNKLYVHGPMHYIQSGWKPNFIIVACQPTDIWANQIIVDRFLDGVFSNPIYRVDSTKWYLTGLSGGAAAIFNYVTLSTNEEYRRPSAIIPFSITTGCQCGDFYAETDYLCGTDFRYQLIPSWGFAGSGDSHHDKMKRLFTRMQQAGWNARWTSYSGGHCCWNDFYNPAYKESINGVQMNIYEWALQYPLVALPVTFSYFEIANNILKWGTSTEIDNDYFEVQESEDGINWKTISTVPSKALNGNSSSNLSYTFNL